MNDPRPLSNREGEALAATVAQLAAAQLPLAAGLRAAAGEATGSLASGLRRMAEEVERGRSLEQICSAAHSWLPQHVRGMVAAAARTGQLGPALDELLHHQRSIRRTFWHIWLAMAYPVLVGVLNLIVMGFLLYYVVPVFKQMFEEFDLTLPFATRALIQLSDMAVWLVAGFGQGTLALFLVVVGLLAFFAITGRGGTLIQRYVVESMPLVGVLWQWSGAAGFLYLLGALLDKNIPLAEALQLTADGTSKSDLREAGRWLAGETARGESLASLVEHSRCLPASSIPLLRWGERTNSLPEALRLLNDMFLERVQQRSDWLRTVSPPFVYILVAISTASILIALYMPMITLIQGLV